MVQNSIHNLCYVVSEKYAHVGSVTTVKIFTNRHIVLKQTNGKLNWFNDFNNPLEKQFQYFFYVSNYSKHQTIYTQTHLHSFFIRSYTILQWKNINRLTASTFSYNKVSPTSCHAYWTLFALVNISTLLNLKNRQVVLDCNPWRVVSCVINLGCCKRVVSSPTLHCDSA